MVLTSFTLGLLPFSIGFLGVLELKVLSQLQFYNFSFLEFYEIRCLLPSSFMLELNDELPILIKLK